MTSNVPFSAQTVFYCPVCQRLITAENAEDPVAAVWGGYVFVHDAVVHTQSDMQALALGIQ